MTDFFSINRNALLVRPSAEFLKWIESQGDTDRDNSYSNETPEEYLQIFLVPEFDSVQEAQQWLEGNYQPFLEFLLEDWCADEEQWPESLDWALFRRFFNVSFQEMIVDTVEEDYDS